MKAYPGTRLDENEAGSPAPKEIELGWLPVENEAGAAVELGPSSLSNLHEPWNKVFKIWQFILWSFIFIQRIQIGHANFLKKWKK